MSSGIDFITELELMYRHSMFGIKIETNFGRRQFFVWQCTFVPRSR